MRQSLAVTSGQNSKRRHCKSICEMQRAAENFVTGGFVVDARAVEHVGEMGQKLCAQKKSQAAFGTIRAHAVDHVRLALFERAQQSSIILRVVFEIGILDQNIFAAGVLERSADSCAFAAVLFVEYYSHIFGERHGSQFLARAVGGTIVDDDDFFLYRRGMDGLQKFIRRARPRCRRAQLRTRILPTAHRLVVRRRQCRYAEISPVKLHPSCEDRCLRAELPLEAYYHPELRALAPRKTKPTAFTVGSILTGQGSRGKILSPPATTSAGPS